MPDKHRGLCVSRTVGDKDMAMVALLKSLSDCLSYQLEAALSTGQWSVSAARAPFSLQMLLCWRQVWEARLGETVCTDNYLLCSPGAEVNL